MTPHGRRIWRYLSKLFDLGALSASVVVALILFASPHGVTLAGSMAMRIKLENCLVFALLLLLWHNLFIFCGLYTSKRLTRRRTQIVEVCKAALLAAMVLFLSAKVLHMRVVTSSFVLAFWVLVTVIMVAGRLTARACLMALRRRGRNSRHILIIGTNERATEFARRISGHPELGYHIVGFVDDDWDGTPAFESTGHLRCCNFFGLADFLRRKVVDEAAIYLPLRSYYEHAAELVALCEQYGIIIRFDSQLFKPRHAPAQIPDLEETTQLHAVAGGPELLPAIIKRTLDCLFAASLLLFLAPTLLVVAALVKLTSPGPVFFRQTRIGLNKRQFIIYKFRTMVANAEQLQDRLLARNEMSGPVFKISKDPRVTPLGRFLRKTSIDEFPQLFNVLIGDMSLVGPRAMSLRDYRLFDQDWQRRRFSVKPGITCLWQVRGRNSIPFEQWMELDMQYIDKWSLWLDLKILALTVPAVLRGTGAA